MGVSGVVLILGLPYCSSRGYENYRAQKNRWEIDVISGPIAGIFLKRVFVQNCDLNLMLTNSLHDWLRFININPTPMNIDQHWSALMNMNQQ